LVDTKEIFALNNYGMKNTKNIYRNLSNPSLYEQAVLRKEGLVAHLGPFVVSTGRYTGRSPKDKFTVKEESSEKHIWWGKENKPFEITQFNNLYARILAYLQGRDVFVQDCFAGCDPKYRIPIRIITEYAWHSLFARNMFLQIKTDIELQKIRPEFTIFCVPGFNASPEIDGTNSEAFIIVNFGRRMILIGGTAYAGEMKKAVFTVLNYLLPREEVLSMHCSANMGDDNDTALFFGLSGTGKTTLSTDISRRLIGDDEHGWSSDGIFNFEGGCYAKVIKISAEHEPQIYQCTRKFGTILENVTIDPKTRRLDLNDASATENTRASYPITHIDNTVKSGIGAHPKNIFMLSCDMFGVMPPIALLTPQQAAYYYLQGYTARVAGTEMGLGRDPEAVFSPCFGAPFLALPPMKYTNLLLKHIIKYNVHCWMINTGWIMGGYGSGSGHRIPLPYTRTLINEAIKGSLETCPMSEDPVFGFQVVTECPDVPKEILDPSVAYCDKNEFNDRVRILVSKFIANMETLGEKVPEDVLNSGPKLP
jgi:phosphoenolpyruvate carboxykinase (ATP)